MSPRRFSRPGIEARIEQGLVVIADQGNPGFRRNSGRARISGGGVQLFVVGRWIQRERLANFPYDPRPVRDKFFKGDFDEAALWNQGSRIEVFAQALSGEPEGEGVLHCAWPLQCTPERVAGLANVFYGGRLVTGIPEYRHEFCFGENLENFPHAGDVSRGLEKDSLFMHINNSKPFSWSRATLRL